MPVLAEAVVEVKADMTRLDKDLPQAQASITKFAGTAKAALAGLGVAAAASLGAAMFDAAKKASDFGETLSKVKTVFGNSASLIIGKADELADKFGLVKQTTLDAAANIGLVGQAAGLSQVNSAKLGVQMAQLAADAASFYNVPLDVALEKIRAGLVGESEPLRAFGVLLSEDAVKAEALKLGLTKNAASISDQAKVMARASIIVRSMATASGDLERTQDSAANQMKKFTGDLENFKVELGQSMIAPLTEAIALMRELGKATGDTKVAGEGLGGWMQATLASLRGLLGVVTGESAAEVKKRFGFDKRSSPSPFSPEELETKMRESRARAGTPTMGDILKATFGPKEAEHGVPKLRDLHAEPEKDLTPGERKAGELEAEKFRETKGTRDLAGKLDKIVPSLTAGLGKLVAAAPTLLGKLALDNPALKLGAVAARHAAVTEHPKLEASITTGEEFQRMAQLASLNSGEGRIPAEQLEELKELKTNSKSMLEALQDIARKVGLPVPAVVKGRT